MKAVEYLAGTEYEAAIGALRNLRQAAFDGQIEVWGRPRQTNFDRILDEHGPRPLTRIPQNYWAAAGFDELHCLSGDAPEGCRTKPDHVHAPDSFLTYQDVRVNLDEIMKRLPKPAKH